MSKHRGLKFFNHQDGKVMEVTTNLRDFCIKNKLCYNNMGLVVSGKLNNHKKITLLDVPYINGHKLGGEKTAKKLVTGLSDFIKKASSRFNNKYDYSLVNYKNSRTKVTIICPVHGEFEQLPYYHLVSKGCRRCASSGGWRKTQWLEQASKKANGLAYLYVFKMSNTSETFYKIGITLNIENRIRTGGFPYKVDVIYSRCDKADIIWELEHYFHKIHKDNKYIPILNFPGKTECFKTIDINKITNYEKNS